jgi:polyisoprenoid-binding protein YceI
MRTAKNSVVRLLVLLMLVPLAAACSKTTAAVATAGAAAAAAVGYSDRGATTTSTYSVTRLAIATEMAFKEMGITLTERKSEDDGIEIKGAEGDWKVVVDIERDADETRSEVEVTVSKDQVNYEKSRAEQILRRIVAHVQH